MTQTKTRPAARSWRCPAFARLLALACGVGLVSVASPAEAIIKVTKTTWLGDAAWKIEGSANGTFYFEAGDTGGTGFSSAIDQENKDWILNDASKASGMVREYRGFPNLGDDNFNHPQRNSGSKTQWVGQAPTATMFEGESLVMKSSNTNFEVEYHFFATHIALKMIRAGGRYSFLYEGPIGGVHQPGVDWIVGDSDPMPGTQRPVMNSPLGAGRPVNGDINTTAFVGRSFGKFFYMGDPVAKQVFFVAKTPDTAETDEGYGQASNMTIASFGRGLVNNVGTRQLTGTANVCTFGFLTKELGHPAIKTFIEGTLANPFMPAAGGQGGGGGAGGTGGAAGGAGIGGAGMTGGAAGKGGAAGGGGAAGATSGRGGSSGATAAGGAASGSGGAPSTGGVPAAGGSATSGGAPSSSGGTSSSSGGTPSSSGGTSPSSGGTPTSSGGSSAVGGQSPAGPSSEDDGGCALGTQPPSSSGAAGFGAIALALAALARARRRTRERAKTR
ncbi:MAG TPA: hypothetical protein VER33_11920 [Polyangiaceae bacterium]|nr:hypothetical protein [Polyangiaceae bacterium]